MGGDEDEEGEVVTRTEGVREEYQDEESADNLEEN